MKKTLCILVFLIMTFVNIHIYAEGEITLFLDDKKISCSPSPLIINDRTMIPARAVFEGMGARVTWDEENRTVGVLYNDIEIEMKIDSSIALVNDKEMKLDSPAVIVSDRTMIPLRFVGETLGAEVSWDGATRSVYIVSPENVVPPVIIESVEFSVKDEYDYVTMSSSGKAMVKTMTLTEPTRMVIDIQNASLAVKNASYKGNSVSELRYGDHEDYVRFVAESEKLPGFIIFDNSGFTELKLYEEKGNFDYIGMAEHIIVFDKGNNIRFTSKKDNVLLFESDTELKDEITDIGDELVESIEINGTEIKVKLKKDAEYEINKNMVCLKGKEEEKEEKIYNSGIVVLDAGHGGNDPGTLGYDEDGETILANEKDMNLTITLMVNEMLNTQNVKTVLTRSDDTYIGLKERADIANKYNAELFVSIHNNSIPNPEYKGSMVLYSLKSSGGKNLASNILREMTLSAGTLDKGLRDGTNMSVIKNTAMPAVIVECGCLTNQEELENLMDIDFLYKLAEGIAEGILIALEK